MFLKTERCFTLLPWDSYSGKWAKHPHNYCWQNTVSILSSVAPMWYVVKAAFNISVSEMLVWGVRRAQKRPTIVMLEKQNILKTSASLRWYGSNYCYVSEDQLGLFFIKFSCLDWHWNWMNQYVNPDYSDLIRYWERWYLQNIPWQNSTALREKPHKFIILQTVLLLFLLLNLICLATI